MSLSSRKTRRDARVRSIRRTSPPRLEQLEARLVLSTITVINTDDDGAGSLRQAIVAANANVGGDTIRFAPGVTGTITLTSGELAITDAVDLEGPGSGVVTVSGNNASRVFSVRANATISGLTISRGSSDYGGGICNDGTLTVRGSTLSGNSAPGYGGGIFNDGTLTVESSTLSDNSSGFQGGGIVNIGGTLTVDSSTISGNSAYDGGGITNRNSGTLTVLNSTVSGNAGSQIGGGISNDEGTLTVQNSTLSSNTAGSGGGIYNRSTATVHNSTLSGNTAGTGGGIYNGGSYGGTMMVESSTLSGNTAGYGGGISNGFSGALTLQNSTLSGNTSSGGGDYGGGIYNVHSGTLTVLNSTLSGNQGGGIYNRSSGTSTLSNTIVAANFSGDIDGTVASSSSHNLIGMDTNLIGISDGVNSNRVGTAAAPINPMLGPLQGNGGPTQTMALLPGSPAVNAGDNTLIPAGVTTDQRGTGYARIESGTVDIGAFEVVVAPASLSGVVFSDFNNDGQVDFGEHGIPGVPIALTGTDDLGHVVSLSQTTDNAGAYVFLNLRPGSYTIIETHQPTGYTPGIVTAGTGGGSVSGFQITVSLPAGLDAMNNNYGEQPVATGGVRNDQTAGIGFWNNKRGQALIKALNGGVGTQLGNWLAATFPHIFGTYAGSDNLAGDNNAAVAAFFQKEFVIHGVKLDAQVLATALSVYVTNSTLDNTGVGTQYDFIVSGNGVGTATFNVGNNGAAFGVANCTKVTVMDLLLAVDSQAVNGVLYNGDKAKREMANDVFSALNEGEDD